MTGDASFDIDQVTGTIKLGATASVTDVSNPVNSRADVNIGFALQERFTIVGTGQITFRLAIDGLLEATDPGFGLGSSFARRNSRMFLFRNGVRVGQDAFNDQVENGGIKVVDAALVFTANSVESGDHFFNLLMDVTSQARGRWPIV